MSWWEYSFPSYHASFQTPRREPGGPGNRKETQGTYDFILGKFLDKKEHNVRGAVSKEFREAVALIRTQGFIRETAGELT